jgi:hypothetical protein
MRSTRLAILAASSVAALGGVYELNPTKAYADTPVSPYPELCASAHKSNPIMAQFNAEKWIKDDNPVVRETADMSDAYVTFLECGPDLGLGQTGDGDCAINNAKAVYLKSDEPNYAWYECVAIPQKGGMEEPIEQPTPEPIDYPVIEQAPIESTDQSDYYPAYNDDTVSLDGLKKICAKSLISKTDSYSSYIDGKKRMQVFVLPGPDDEICESMVTSKTTVRPLLGNNKNKLVANGKSTSISGMGDIIKTNKKYSCLGTKNDSMIRKIGMQIVHSVTYQKDDGSTVSRRKTYRSVEPQIVVLSSGKQIYNGC